MDETTRPVEHEPPPPGAEAAGAPPPAGAPFAWSPSRPEASLETAPVAPVGRRSGGLRWGIALGLVAVLIAVTAAAAFLLTGSGAPSVVSRWTPAGTAVYAEARFDLPGDQERLLGEFLSHFPGFDDQAALDDKLAEVLDRLLDAATDGRNDWQTDIAPWFGGEVGVALGDLSGLMDPELGLDGSSFGPGAAAPPALVLATVRDADLAEAWLASQGDVVRTEDHGGATLNLVDLGSSEIAWTVHAGVALAGDPATVRAAIDTGGSGGLASDAGFADARDALSGDHLGLVYLDLRAYLESLQEAIGDLGELDGFDFEALVQGIPDWGIFAIRATGDGLALEAIAPLVPSTDGAVPGPSALLELAPPSTIALVEVRDVGAGIRAMFDRLRDQGMGDAVDEIEGALALLGGPEAALDWIGNAGLVVTAEGNDVSGALVISPTDPDAATRLATTLQGFLALGGGELGLDIRREDHAGETITIIDVGDLGNVGGGLGVPLDPGAVSLAYVVADDVVALGIDPESIRAILDARSEPSLADDSRATALIERAGAEATFSAWFDLAAFREVIERSASEMGEPMADYDREVKPYLRPFDGLAIALTSDGELNRSSLVITVRD
jgi:hypothetical protein